MTILLLLAFLAWSQGITWLFLGSLVLFIIVARSIGIVFLVITGIAALYFLHMQQYWFILLILIVAFILLVQSKKQAGASEMYSPELMRLLGGS